MKKFMGLTIAVLTIGTLAGCGTKAAATAPVNNTTTAPVQTVSDKDQAAQVVKDFLASEGSFTYKDSSSFKAPDQFLVLDLAKQFDSNNASVPATFQKLKAVGSHSDVTIKFLGQNGDTYSFEGTMTASAVSDDTKKSAGTRMFDDEFQVSKQPNGKFLIVEMHDIKK